MASPHHAPNTTPAQFIFCLSQSAVLTALAAPWLPRAQKYSDLVSGSITVSDAAKIFDYALLSLLLASFAALWLVTHFLSKKLIARGAAVAEIDRALWLSLIPATLWAGSAIVLRSPGTAPVEVVWSGAAVTIVLLSLLGHPALSDAQELRRLIAIPLLATMLACFSAIGALTAGSRLMAAPITADIVGRCVFASGALTVIGCAALLASRRATPRRLASVLRAAQLPLPLLLAAILPPVILAASGERVAPPHSAPLLALLIASAFVCLALGLKKFRGGPLDRGVAANLSISLLLPIAVFMAVDHRLAPTFFGDDFHLGEHLLPWQQLRDFGKVPFRDFVPIHPLMDLALGAFNDLFFDGTLANFRNSRALLFAIGAACSFAAIARFSSPLLALALCLAADVWDRLLFVAPAIILLSLPAMIARCAAWLGAWAALCLAMVFYNPAVGIALTLASSPMAVIQAQRMFKQSRPQFIRATAIGCMAILAVLLAPTFRAVLLGLLVFILENGQTNVIAHGLEWRPGSGTVGAGRGVLGSNLVWELFRLTWLPVMLGTAAIALGRWRGWTHEAKRLSMLAPAGLTALFLLVLASWTLNRIDPMSFSRTGEVSYLAVLHLLPIALFAASGWRFLPPALLIGLIAFYAQGTAGFPNGGSLDHFPMTWQTLLRKPASVQMLPPDVISSRPLLKAMPNLGEIHAHPDRLDRLVKLRLALAELLREGETFLDLTNQQAFYFYLGMPTALSYGAPWVTANRALQQRLIHEIEKNPPPVVLAAPAMLHDTGPVGVRTYQLYRYLLARYVPVRLNGFIFLVAPHRMPPDAAGRRAEQLETLTFAFAGESLGRLPAAWGRSWEKFTARFEPVRSLGDAQTPAAFDSSAAPIAGADADFLKFDLDAKTPVELVITWQSEDGAGTARLIASPGTQLIPLGSQPRWLLAGKITWLEIAAQDGANFPVRRVQLLRLRD